MPRLLYRAACIARMNWVWLRFAGLAWLALMPGLSFAQQAGTPFQAQSLTFAFNASTAVGTPIQIVANGIVTNFGQYVVANTGANGVWITLANTATAATQTLPASGTPGNAVWIEPGTSRTLTGPSQAWFNAQTPSGTTTLDITGGTGSLTGVTQVGAGGTGGGSATAANQTIVQNPPGTSGTTAESVQGVTGGVPVPVSGTVTTTPSGTQTVNEAQINGAAVVTGAGTTTSAQRVTVAQDTTTIAGSPNTTVLTVTQSSQPLPSGAAQSAYQLNVEAGGGVSATAAVAVQGISGGVPVIVQGSPTAVAQPTTIVPSSLSSVGITPVVTPALASNLVLKNSPGNLYGVEITTTSVGGYLMVFNATSAPADGAVTPVESIAVTSANTSYGLSFGSNPDYYSTGITAVFSTTGPFTKTASATAFIKGRVQ